MEPDTSLSISSVRTTKRKLEDAIRTLDDAVVPHSVATTIGSATPSKRAHLSRSVYSTLVKFDGTSKERSRPSSDSRFEIDVSKSAPHLSAILARSASKSKQNSLFGYPPTPPAHPLSEYRPSSTESFLSRLATYKITTYSNKPSQIDTVAAAKCGWINDGKDRLVCGMCDVSWVLAGREGMSKDAASALIEKQRISLVEMHKDGCPWKVRQCEPSVYRVPLQAPTAMVRELRATALSLEPLLANVTFKHPLTSSQLSSLRLIFSVLASERSVLEHDSIADVDEATRPAAPSDTAIIVALFGWVPSITARHYRIGSLFSHMVSSSGPSASMPPTPSLSRTSSISSRFRERESTPTPSGPALMGINQPSTSPNSISASLREKNSWSGDATTTTSQNTPLVYCPLCQRRVGLWNYAGSEETIRMTQDAQASSSREHQKEFDVVKEHRSYCPYIVRSSVVPSFSHSPEVDSLGSAVEGWRAVLAVVQRYELGQRQRLSRFVASDDLSVQAASTELKEVEAMVTGVKTNGGRELLRYVRTLLG